MDLDNITKENMKRLTNKDSVPITDILLKIKDEAENGREYLYITDFQISENHKLELEKRGFTVRVGGRFNEVNTSISWS